MAATPKPVRKRHKASNLEIKKKLDRVIPEKPKAKAIYKAHTEHVKKKKSEFKKMGGKY